MERYIDANALINRIVFHTDLPQNVKEAFEDEINAELTADVVSKEKYDKLLENATILANAVYKYRKHEEESED